MYRRCNEACGHLVTPQHIRDPAPIFNRLCVSITSLFGIRSSFNVAHDLPMSSVSTLDMLNFYASSTEVDQCVNSVLPLQDTICRRGEIFLFKKIKIEKNTVMFIYKENFSNFTNMLLGCLICDVWSSTVYWCLTFIVVFRFV